MPTHRVIALLFILFVSAEARAQSIIAALGNPPRRLERLNATLGGTVLDFTNHHGRDNRIYAPTLCQWRNCYVYLPPGYDGRAQFPSILWLHGLPQTESDFLGIVKFFDEGIRCGTFPPCVIIAPDGSVRNRVTLRTYGSFYLNTKGGNFEDYIVRDVWGWAKQAFALRPERDAHCLAGGSMGGFGAFNLSFKHRQEFGLIAGVMPSLDTRYADCHGNKFADYDPNCIGRREEFPRRYVIARFFGGLLRVRQGRITDPLFGRFGKVDPEFMRVNNPVEMLDLYDIRPGEFQMFIAYGTKDDFNIDAEDEHFIDVARRRGIQPTVARFEGLHHTVSDGVKMFPALSRWIYPLLAPYVPMNYRVGDCCAPEIRALPLETSAGRPRYLSPFPSRPGTVALR